MAGNSIGKSLVLTSFGESHGIAVGGVLDGFPSNLVIDTVFIQSEIDRRSPGSDFYASARNEKDRLEILSGIYEGKSTGAPIAFIVHNGDHRPGDYDHLAGILRPSHADYTWLKKYGIRDPRGGGRASARETQGISITAGIRSVGGFNFPEPVARLTDQAVLDYLEQVKSSGDTVGGVVSCSVTGVPAGLGEPVFDKLQADLGKAMLGINAVKGFEYGSGFRAAGMKGSEHNDAFFNENGVIRTRTNHSGGIQGGISNGEEIYFNVAFKPVSTLMMDQETVTTTGETATFGGKGRHDVCVVPRALPIVEAMAALVIADHLIRNGEMVKW